MRQFVFSMNSLLTHTVAHSTRPFFRPKTNNQPLKKFLSLAFSWVKLSKIVMSKIIWIFLFFLLKNIILGAHFLKTSIFKPLNFLKWCPIFDNFYSTDRLKNFLRGWLLVLDLKECLVECATVCVKSEVILKSNRA